MPFDLLEDLLALQHVFGNQTENELEPDEDELDECYETEFKRMIG